MNKALRYFLIFFVVATILFLAWYFMSLVAYILISVVISFIGQPLVQLIERIPHGKKDFPRALSTSIALLLILSIFVSLIGIFVPLIAGQAKALSSIDIATINAKLSGTMKSIQSWLSWYGIMPAGQTLPDFLKTKMELVLNVSSFSNLAGSILSITGSFFIGIFSVLFMSFFFIKDEKLISKSVLLLVPQAYHEETGRIMSESKRLVSRYFIGLCLEIASLLTMLSFGLWIAGIKNALLIAFFAGMLNIIPYLGYFIGAGFGIFVSLTGLLAMGVFTGIFKTIMIVIIVFLIVKLIDDMFLQPLIYSSSVKAHPLEIFLVIMIGGTLAGIPGMILAVPSYTVIRVIAREFFSHTRIVKKLTENL